MHLHAAYNSFKKIYPVEKYNQIQTKDFERIDL